MKARFIAALLCVVIPSSVALAGDSTGSYINDGQKGLLFMFNGLSNIGADNYLPNGIGAQLYLSKVVAVRAGVEFATYSENIPYVSYTGTAGTDGSSSQTIFGVAGDVLFHLNSNRVSPYVGAGVLFQTSSDSYTDAVANGSATKEVDDTLSTSGMTLDVHAIVGAQFFITKNVSLSAEYHLGWNMFSPYDQTNIDGISQTTTVKGSVNTFGFMTNAGQMTLGFYF